MRQEDRNEVAKGKCTQPSNRRNWKSEIERQTKENQTEESHRATEPHRQKPRQTWRHTDRTDRLCAKKELRKAGLVGGRLRDWKGSWERGSCEGREEMAWSLCRVLACQISWCLRHCSACSESFLSAWKSGSCLYIVLTVRNLPLVPTTATPREHWTWEPSFSSLSPSVLFSISPWPYNSKCSWLYMWRHIWSRIGKLQTAVWSWSGDGVAVNTAFGRDSKAFSPRTLLTILNVCLEVHSTETATLQYSIIITEKPDYTGKWGKSLIRIEFDTSLRVRRPQRQCPGFTGKPWFQPDYVWLIVSTHNSI